MTRVFENEGMNKEVAFFELSFAGDLLGLKASNGYTIIRTGRSSAMTCYAVYDENGKYVCTPARLDDAMNVVRGDLSILNPLPWNKKDFMRKEM